MSFQSIVSNSNREWVQFIPQVCASYAMTPHTVTGFTPFELYYGRKPRRLIATDAPTTSPTLPSYTTEDYETTLAQTSERVSCTFSEHTNQ